jgi:integrase
VKIERTRYPGIYTRADRYVAVVSFRDARGRNRQRWITTPTLKAALKARRDALGNVDRGVQLEGGDVTVEVMVGEWLAAHRDTWRPFTTRNYASIASRYIVPNLGHLKLREVTKRRIQSFLAALPTPAVARYAYTVLSTAFTWASVDQDLIAYNPVRAVRRPSAKRPEARHLTPEQTKGLLAKVRGHDLEPAVVLGLLAGLRAGEACGLAWGDINLATAALTVRRSFWGDTKGGSSRSLTLPETAVSRLREHKRRQAELLLATGVRQTDSTPVLANAVGEPLPPWRLHDRFRALSGEYGLGVTYHALRHSHAIALLTAGVDVRTVAGRLGHTSAALVLSTYSHFVASSDEAAAERLERFLG